MIKSVYNKLLKAAYNYSGQFHYWLDSILNPKPDSNFDDLTPRNDGKRDEYIDALEWAIQNKNVKNIALTGPFGSGKSSILKKFQYLNPRVSFLNISLASFSIANIKKPKEINQLIEQSILQQIFYKEKASKIRQSRFRRIIKPKILPQILRATGIVLWLICCFGLFLPMYFNSLSPWQISSDISTTKLAIGFLIGFFLLLFNGLHYLNDTSLSKLNLIKGEIELSKHNIEASIFNKYIDEIIYCFQQGKYKIVIIEDLDRFQNPQILIKLREINLLLNEADDIVYKPIIFIYAVRDDLFNQDEKHEKTKFFDFIIPVIPIINSSNSRDILSESLVNSGINKTLINQVSHFIGDMRVLKNIINEYLIYRGKLSVLDLAPNKVFSIIVYKNLEPEDFSKLHTQEGVIYRVFKIRNQIINEKKNTLSQAITLLENFLKK